jgi:hypothetical protein
MYGRVMQQVLAVVPRPAWWPTFGKVLVVVAAWHVLPAAYFAMWFIRILNEVQQKPSCFDSCPGFAMLAVFEFGLLVVASLIIGLILAAITASFRPKRPFLVGNLVMIAEAAIIVTLLLSGVNA